MEGVVLKVDVLVVVLGVVTVVDFVVVEVLGVLLVTVVVREGVVNGIKGVV